MTSVAPCPYLPGRTERKVFANLPFSDGAHVNDELTIAGFRRSQNIASVSYTHLRAHET